MNYRQAFSAPATGGETKTKHGSPDTGGEIKNLLAVLHPPQLIPRTASTPPQRPPRHATCPRKRQGGNGGDKQEEQSPTPIKERQNIPRKHRGKGKSR